MQLPTLSPRQTSPAAANPDAERHWRGGVEHARAGRWKDAEKAHARAVRAAPNDPLFWVNLGQARRKLGDLDGAAAAAEEALRVDPSSKIAVQLRLATRLERHRYADALEDAERVTRYESATHQQWADYGVALYHLGRHQEAVSALLRALACKPDFFDAHVALCNVFDRIGLHAEAVECLRTALMLKPGWGAGIVGAIYHSLYSCDWSHLEDDLRELAAVLEHPEPQDFGPFMFLSFGTDAAGQRRVFSDHARLNHAHESPLPPVASPVRAVAARLRIGDLSNDFHQHATAGARRLVQQSVHDELIGQPMKAIAPHTFIGQRLRQREGVVHFGQCGVERSVKTGNLRQIRKGFLEGSHTLQVVRLVQGSQRVQPRELRQNVRCDDDAGRKIRATMHHTVGHRLDGGHA